MPALFLVVWRFIVAIYRAFKNPEFQALAAAVVTILAGGTLFYMRYEGWGLIDSLYFSVITLTTVGYGDLSPTTTVGKIFTIFYILLGLGLIAAFIAAIAQQVSADAKSVTAKYQKSARNNDG